MHHFVEHVERKIDMVRVGVGAPGRPECRPPSFVVQAGDPVAPRRVMGLVEGRDLRRARRERHVGHRHATIAEEPVGEPADSHADVADSPGDRRDRDWVRWGSAVRRRSAHGRRRRVRIDQQPGTGSQRNSRSSRPVMRSRWRSHTYSNVVTIEMPIALMETSYSTEVSPGACST